MQGERFLWEQGNFVVAAGKYWLQLSSGERIKRILIKLDLVVLIIFLKHLTMTSISNKKKILDAP